MTAIRKSVVAVSAMGIAGCAHTPKQCHQEWFYRLEKDGSIEVRGVVEGSPGGAQIEPYRVIPPSDPEYQRVLGRIQEMEPAFLRKGRFQINRMVDCG